MVGGGWWGGGWLGIAGGGEAAPEAVEKASDFRASILEVVMGKRFEKPPTVGEGQVGFEFAA